MIKGPTLNTIRERLKDHPEAVDQLPALKECIETRWEVLAIKGSKSGLPYCQLCNINNNCPPCVIYYITGKSGCNSTPWEDWAGTHGEEEIKAAKNEVNFLRRIERVLEEMK